MPTRAAADLSLKSGRGRLLYEDLLAAFVDELHVHRYSRSLTDLAERILPRLFTTLRRQRVRDIRAVNEAHLTSFLRQLAKTKTARGTVPSPATLLAYTNILRRFFAYLDKHGLILRNPAQDLPARRIEQLPARVLSPREVEALVSAPHRGVLAGVRDAAVLEVLYGTGIRLSECHRLDLQDLDLKEGLLLVRNGKGKKDRVVPVAGRAAAALQAYLDEVRPAFVHDPRESALFLTRHGDRLGKVTIGVSVLRYGRAVGIKASPHSLRHAYATHLLQGGADVRHLQELLGHRFLESTAIYARVAVKDLRAVLSRAHPRDRAGRLRRRPAQ